MMIIDIQTFDIVEDDVRIPHVFLFCRNSSGQSVAIRVKDWEPWVRFELRDTTEAPEVQQFILRTLHKSHRFQIRSLRRFHGYVGTTQDPTVPKMFKYVDIRMHSFASAGSLQKRNLEFSCVDKLQQWSTKFCNDLGIVTSDWITVPDIYELDASCRFSTCDIEYEVPYKEIQKMEKTGIAPIKIMSFDCEMYSHDGLFPNPAKNDYTSVIGASIWSYGSETVKNVAIAVSDEPLADTIVVPHSGALIDAFRKLIVEEDPDIITGWNIYGFDFQFMHHDYKNECLKGHCPDQDAYLCTRFIDKEMTFTEQKMSSAAKGDNTYRYWSMPGRITVDLMQIIKDDKKPEDNTLKHVAALFLDPEFGKLDMTPHEMFEAWRIRDKPAMEAVIRYCIRDAEIPIKLIQKLVYVPSWVEMSRVCYTNLVNVLNGGQQRRVFNVIARFVHNEYAINEYDCGWPVQDDTEDDERRKPDYQGATVIEPISGFYQTPVSVLDFESLYPSIIIYFNLCHSVLVPKETPVPKDTHEITHTINDQTFTREYSFAKHVTGVLPQLLRHLLKSRKAVKALMNNTNDKFEKFVLNGRQNALKVVCNSVYGFTGVSQQKGLLPCKPVAAVTTLKGRAFIEQAKNYVEQTWKGSKVLYGDTDSIMVLWAPGLSIAEAYALGEKASGEVTHLLRSGSEGVLGTGNLTDNRMAVRLANEKVECPYLLIRKKMYAAVKWTPKAAVGATNEVFTSELEFKGIDAVRRDRTKVVRELSEAVLNCLMIRNDLEEALGLLRQGLSEILENQKPLEDYILSKSLKGSYASENLPHVQAYRRMQARGDSGIPPQGSRMPMVFVTPKKKNTPLYEIAEHPAFVKSRNLKPWAWYYINNIRNVMERLFEPTGINVSKIFDDAETKANHMNSGNKSLLDFFPVAKKTKVQSDGSVPKPNFPEEERTNESTE
jgi:DNA polymerase delta subunit 1